MRLWVKGDLRKEDGAGMTAALLEGLLTDAERRMVAGQLFERAMREEHGLALPDAPTLVRFAEGSLTRAHERRVRQRVLRSTAAMMVTGEFIKQYTPIRRLALGWAGWRGAILSGLGALPAGVTASDWSAHMARCPRSRRRTRLLQGPLGLLPDIGRLLRRFVPRRSEVGRRFGLRAVSASAVCGLIAVIVVGVHFGTAGDPARRSHPKGSLNGARLDPRRLLQRVLAPGLDVEDLLYIWEDAGELRRRGLATWESETALALACEMRAALADTPGEGKAKLLLEARDARSRAEFMRGERDEELR